MAFLAESAKTASEQRRPAAADNPFILAERLWADMVQQSFDI